MSILNYLPTFKSVEPNRLTGLVKVTFFLNSFSIDFKLIKKLMEKKVIENGAIVGLAETLQ